jgi:hypothetical protein
MLVRPARLIADCLLSHCGGSYAAVVVVVPALVWYGAQDYSSVFLISATAPFSFPMMAMEAHHFGRQFLLTGVALLLPVYLLGFAFTLRFRLVHASRRAFRDRVARGLCGRCGYNLTGNASGVCPECGEETC